MGSWRQSALAKPLQLERLKDLAVSFPDYLIVYRNRGPFSKAQLGAHLNALERRSTFVSAEDAVADDAFADLVREVLGQWGVGTRGAQLVSAELFRAEFEKLAPRLEHLNHARIDDADLDPEQVESAVYDLIDSISLVTKYGEPVKNRLVSGTKALHHVLPNLVPPVDREYTQTFFGWHNPEFQYNPRECFKVIFLALVEVARDVGLDRFRGDGWMSSPAKILDNAIVGFCVKHGLKSQSTRQQQKKQAEYRAVVKRLKELGLWDSIEAEAKAKADALLRARR
jgi:hypothetical protein